MAATLICCVPFINLFNLRPDITIVLDVPPERGGAEMIAKKQNSESRFEEKGLPS